MKDVLNNKFTDQVRFTHEHLTPQITEYLAIHEYEIKDNAKKIIDSKPAKGFDRVVYAGYLENEEFTKRSSKGIPYHKEVIDWFRSYCSESEVDFNLD